MDGLSSLESSCLVGACRVSGIDFDRINRLLCCFGLAPVSGLKIVLACFDQSFVLGVSQSLTFWIAMLQGSVVDFGWD